ncbi:MAG: ATP-dependent Clp protease ATP-binding subunit [Anaerolineales bacterium]|nr:ATP-dependent Clp protease ATP-binding subunit [Anaerolineales bacterium]MCB9129086.1 ATP-dependent Clp protease ATP-binding subunit [Ardenticatenales bacterium]MCB9172762.1 ATP-dependent Clp protease ATP-binding subunit [Ardenticatenales bacterium]
MSSNKFDRFTKKARRVLSLARDEAKALNHSYIGSEHLLLGLAREGEGVAARVLNDLDINIDDVRRSVEELVGRGKRPASDQPTLTPRTRRVIELAVDEARRLGHSYIGTEHLLLGLVREGNGIAAEVLANLGVSPDTIRRRATDILKQEPKQATPSPAGKASSSKKEQKSPLMDQLGLDLTEEARQGKLDPVIGRRTEIERMVQILSRRTKNNPALIGEPGVGKTAIVEGLAQQIVNGEVPENLRDKKLWMLDVGSLVAGTIYRGQFEERLKRVVEELKSNEAIVFIDEVHMLVGAGAAGSAVDAANILKPALARGELQVIGATTLDEYRKHVESDAALERRFQPIQVPEPTIEETIDILRGIKDRYEAHHNLEIEDDAIKAAAHLSARYVPDRHLPDKAIDLIDEASSRVRMYRVPRINPLRVTIEELGAVRREKESAFQERRYQEAADLRDRELALQAQIESLRNEETGDSGPTVTKEDIAEVVAMWTGIPMTHINEEETKRLMNMEDELHQRIVGQHEAIEAISKAVRRARAGLKDPRRPIGSFMFLGPTGVGKTELAKSLAEFMFGSQEALIKLDMSEFMERHNVSRLVGSPPGYVGYEEGGQLTEAVRRRPYSVVLLDEIEKAHPEAFNMLLQIMEDGNLADAKGRRVDFRNVIILLTSNVGAELLQRQATLGFRRSEPSQAAESDYDAMKEKVMDELKRRFRPEFLNRLDSVIVFRSLTRDEITDVVDIMVQNFRTILGERELDIALSDGAKLLLVERGYDPNFGARPLRRAIQQMIVDRISEGLLVGDFQPGDVIHVDTNEQETEFTFQSEAGAAVRSPLLEDEVAMDEAEEDASLEEIEALFMSNDE